MHLQSSSNKNHKCQARDLVFDIQTALQNELSSSKQCFKL